MNFSTIVFGAVLVEAVVNIMKNINEKETSWKYWASLVLGIAVAILVALNYNIDFFSALGLEGRIPFVGAVLTGLILSRGSNIVSDVVGAINRRGVPDNENWTIEAHG